MRLYDLQEREGRVRPIYLDHAATTPVRPEVRAAMAPFLDERFGNPSSIHQWGREARSGLEEARERLAGALGAERREVVFTSGGTEADALAVLGRARAVRGAGSPVAVAFSAIEHKAVLGAAHLAGDENRELLVLGVDDQGRVEADSVREALFARPSVVSVMWVNNEVGVVQPIAEIAALCRAAGVAFHTDAVQALGRVPVRVDDVACDLLSVSGHKIGGPKGSGALFVREGTSLEPLIEGGGQERGFRPGTQNVAGAVGLAVAAELAVAELAREPARLAAMRDRLEAGLRASIPDLVVNGAGATPSPHILNVSLAGVEQEALLLSLDLEGIAVSSGSACQSGAVEPSHVLVAMGRAVEGEASIRFSLGRTSMEAEIDEAIARVRAVVERLRAFAGI